MFEQYSVLRSRREDLWAGWAGVVFRKEHYAMHRCLHWTFRAIMISQGEERGQEVKPRVMTEFPLGAGREVAACVSLLKAGA